MKPKLAIICAAGLDNFLAWVPMIEDEYEVRIFRVTTYEDIHAALQWADILWLEWANETAVETLKLKNLLVGKNVVVRLHSYEVFTNLPEQIHWQHVDRLVFVADHVHQIFKEYHPSVSGRFHSGFESVTIPNGVDIDSITPLNPVHGYNIAVVGSVNYKKEPPLVLQVLKKLVGYNAEYHVHWAGAMQDARYDVYLQHMVRELRIEENITFHGHVWDMNSFWDGKNVLLHTSIHEGHCYAIMEAMARGIVPVIHHYFGAGSQYPESYLFNTVNEAALKIMGFMRPGNPRDELIKRGWTLDAQVKNIRNLLGGLS